MKNTFTLKFIRNEGSAGFTSIAFATLTLRPSLMARVDELSFPTDFLVQKLSQGVTSWMRHSEEGEEAFMGTNNDFNIGDLVDFQNSETLKGFLAEQGILGVTVEVHDQGNAVPFDQHLFDWEELQTPA